MVETELLLRAVLVGQALDAQPAGEVADHAEGEAVAVVAAADRSDHGVAERDGVGQGLAVELGVGEDRAVGPLLPTDLRIDLVTSGEREPHASHDEQLPNWPNPKELGASHRVFSDP